MRSTVPEHRFNEEETITYSVELDGTLPDSMFKFFPPKEAERVDLGPVELVGKAAPPLKLKTLDGKDFDLSSLRDKAVLVDFWATWCGPCRESMPHLEKLYDQFKGKGLALVSVSRDEDPADASHFIAQGKYTWINVADPKLRSDAEWGTSLIPRLVLIARGGKVVFESEGFDEDAEAKVRTALHKMDPSFPAVGDGE